MPFIFSRRFIQQCLDVLSTALSAAQYADLVSRLNRKSPDRLAAMWEAVLLSCLVDQPDFAHEVPLNNGRKPDFQICLPDTGVFVVGDVTSVSDKGSKKDNPIELLIEDIGRIASKHGSDISQFDVRVEASDVGDYEKRKIVLSLPKGADRARFLKEELTPYIVERIKTEDYGHKKIFNSGEYHVEVTFKPKSQFSSYGHPSFTSVLHINRNPVWNALKAKADQLRGAPTGALRILFLCDGGSEAMRDRGMNSLIGRDEIVREFLRRETGIDIVVAITVKDEHYPMGQSRRTLNLTWSIKEKWLQSEMESSAVVAEVRQILNDIGEKLPKPKSNAESAVKNLTRINYSIGAWGGLKWGGGKLKMSARAVQRLLAGEIDIAEFNRAHGWTGDNPFANALNDGRTIRNISIEETDRQDDDWLEFEFGDDAELQPFR